MRTRAMTKVTDRQWDMAGFAIHWSANQLLLGFKTKSTQLSTQDLDNGLPRAVQPHHRALDISL